MKEGRKEGRREVNKIQDIWLSFPCKSIIQRVKYNDRSCKILTIVIHLTLLTKYFRILKGV